MNHTLLDIPTFWHQHTLPAADGTLLHVLRTGGKKPALLLLHGVQASGTMWLRTAHALAERFDVVMPDFRGHGRSGRVIAGFSTDLLVQDTLTVISALKLDRPLVVGHSMGADVAGRLAAVHSLAGLVLVDPALANVAALMAFDIDNPPPWMAGLFSTIRALGTMSPAQQREAARSLLPPGTPEWHTDDYAAFVDGLAHFDLDVYRHTGLMSYLCEDAATLAQIGCPTVLLTARSAMPIDTSAGLQGFLNQVPEIRHIPFPESGHFIMFDQFERFIGVVTALGHDATRPNASAL